jgi:hypothetical protein
MDLIERYLAAIGRNLPAKQAGDITAELRDVLLNRVEEREEALGRPLTKGELEALLIEFGNPLVVAWRYRKVQQLIGPEVFPFWWAGLKILLGVVLGIYLVLIILAGLLGRTPAEFKHDYPDIGVVAVFVFGLVTLVCAAFERFGHTEVLTRWRPSRLPPAGVKPRSRFEVAAEGTASTVFIVWWIGLFRFSDFVPFPIDITVKLAPVWADYHWPILAFAVLDVAVAVMMIVRPGNVQLNSAVSMGRYAIGAALFVGVLRAGHWVEVSGPHLTPHAFEQLNRNFDIGMRFGIWGTVLVMAAKAAGELWRLYKARQHRLAPG